MGSLQGKRRRALRKRIEARTAEYPRTVGTSPAKRAETDASSLSQAAPLQNQRARHLPRQDQDR